MKQNEAKILILSKDKLYQSFGSSERHSKTRTPSELTPRIRYIFTQPRYGPRPFIGGRRFGGKRNTGMEEIYEAKCIHELEVEQARLVGDKLKTV